MGDVRKIFFKSLVIGFIFLSKLLSAQSLDTTFVNWSDKYEYILSDSIHQLKSLDAQIIPPKYFEYGFNNVDCFIHKATSSSIQITQIPNTAWFMVSKGLDSLYFQSQHAELIHVSKVKTKYGKEGVMYLLKFQVEKIPFERIMIFTGDYNHTIWLTANYPSFGHNELYEVLVQSLLSIKF